MVANDGVGMVIVDGMEELDSTNIDVHENDKNIEEHDEDFVLLDWENGEEKEANKKFVYWYLLHVTFNEKKKQENAMKRKTYRINDCAFFWK